MKYNPPLQGENRRRLWGLGVSAEALGDHRHLQPAGGWADDDLRAREAPILRRSRGDWRCFEVPYA